jgi:hypothetical protein
MMIRPILALGGVLALILTKVAIDLATKEVESWLDQLPFLILKLARWRLPAELREQLHDEWWLPDLCELRQRDTDRPITRLTKGLQFAFGLLINANHVAGDTGSPSMRSRIVAMIETAIRSDSRRWMAVRVALFIGIEVCGFLSPDTLSYDLPFWLMPMH